MRALYAAGLGLTLMVPIESAPPEAASVTIVRADRPLIAERSQIPVVEPHLAVDPRDSNHLVAAAIVVKATDLSAFDCAVFVSFDGGAAWTRHDFSFSECADPWVAIGEDGTVLLSVLAGHQDGGPADLLVFRSEDGGRTWLGPVSLGSGHDHETIAVDRSTGPRRGSFYITSQTYAEEGGTGGKSRSVALVVRSSDGGRSFPAPTRIFLSNLSLNTHTAVVLSDGALVVSFTDFARAMDKGQLWLDRERSWVLTSDDGGKTFSVPLLVSEVCSKSFGTLAADLSAGPFRDRLYWICTSDRYEDVYLQHSSDRGERWSRPIRVNQGSGTSPYVRTPSVTVNRDGVVGIAWYDGRDGGARYRREFICQEIYFAASLDGGNSFLPEVKVSSEKSCPMSPENGEAGWRWPAGGDYMGLATDAGGQFVLVWADGRRGPYRLHTATLKVNAPGGGH